MTIKGLITCLSLAVLLNAAAFANDGKKLFEDKGCIACHGEDGNTPLDVGYPKLGGQIELYAFNQMKDIKSGARAGALTEAMKPIIDEVSEAEMRILAAYAAQLPGKPQEAQPAADEVAKGKKLYLTKTCIACHGKEGKKPVVDPNDPKLNYPKLAGQDKTYLVAQMKDIKSGARNNGNTKAMKDVMHLVNDEEMATIAGYLASLAP